MPGLLSWNLAAYGCVCLVFHSSEFLLAALYMRDELGWSSLLLSKAYLVATAIALMEHLTWAWVAPWIRQQTLVAVTGLAVLLIGDLIRKAGMITAGSAFTHKIRLYRREEHKLITHGVYRYMRHPGYLGWLLWAVGAQLLLVNPICTILFAFWACRFFKQRIEFEEDMLLSFFPEYGAYRLVTPAYIPGVP